MHSIRLVTLRALSAALLLSGYGIAHADDGSLRRLECVRLGSVDACGSSDPAWSTKRGLASTEQQSGDEESGGIRVSHPGKGIQFLSADERYKLHFSLRGQFRFSSPFDSDPRRPAAFQTADRSSFDIRRARLKFDGNVYQKWLKYYLEYDVTDNRLLDLRMTVAKDPRLQLRAGQFKIQYNRERVDSSGKQQFAERSIVNREFTVDRQIGAMVFGHLWEARGADSW